MNLQELPQPLRYWMILHKDNCKIIGINFKDILKFSYYRERELGRPRINKVVEINEVNFPDLPRDLDGFWETGFLTDYDEVDKLMKVNYFYDNLFKKLIN